MFKRLIGIAALALSFTALAQPQPTVVDLPTRPGVTQRMLVITPPEPKAAVVLLAGGHGGCRYFRTGRSNGAKVISSSDRGNCSPTRG